MQKIAGKITALRTQCHSFFPRAGIHTARGGKMFNRAMLGMTPLAHCQRRFNTGYFGDHVAKFQIVLGQVQIALKARQSARRREIDEIYVMIFPCLSYFANFVSELFHRIVFHETFLSS
jgi:hypothetical protein